MPHLDQQVSKIYYLSPHKVHLFGIQDEAVGSIYFKSPFIIHIFGICNTNDVKSDQSNYTIGEDELPEGKL